jgi:NADH-quinone oxidoreductase subunit J
MNVAFYVAALVAIVATAMAITRANAVHGLLYLIVSLFAAAVVFLILGAPLVAALEVIIYAGAIMVLFVFVTMMLNLGPQTTAEQRELMRPAVWIGPGLLGFVLAIELLYVFRQFRVCLSGSAGISPQQVGIALYGTYLLGVEIASMLLLAGLVGAYHLARRDDSKEKGECRNGRNSA